MVIRGKNKMPNRQYRSLKLSLLLIAFILFASNSIYSQANISVAILTKVIQDVSRKSVEYKDWRKAKKGESLISGDFLKTGKKSLAVVKFTDNSMLRVREETEIRITGTLSGSAFSKDIGIQNGGFYFQVTKQQNEQFIFTSPTSVASIRGTKGKMSSGPSGDTLTITEGIVNLKNKSSNKDVDVSAGSIGFSNPDGTIYSRQATNDELAEVNNAANSEKENELNFELRDPQGNKKNLKIKYK
jgi:hypothetical protein